MDAIKIGLDRSCLSYLIYDMQFPDREINIQSSPQIKQIQVIALHIFSSFPLVSLAFDQSISCNEADAHQSLARISAFSAENK